MFLIVKLQYNNICKPLAMLSVLDNITYLAVTGIKISVQNQKNNW